MVAKKVAPKPSRNATSKPIKKKASKPTQHQLASSVAIALLEAQSEQRNIQFDGLSEKIDRIIARMEELSLSTVRHHAQYDQQIAAIQKQILSMELTQKSNRETLTQLSQDIPGTTMTKIVEANDRLMADIKHMIDDLKASQEKIENRLTSLERWRAVLVGAGAVVGWGITTIVNRLFN